MLPGFDRAVASGSCSSSGAVRTSDVATMSPPCITGERLGVAAARGATAIQRLTGAEKYQVSCRQPMFQLVFSLIVLPGPTLLLMDALCRGLETVSWTLVANRLRHKRRTTTRRWCGWSALRASCGARHVCRRCAGEAFSVLTQ